MLNCIRLSPCLYLKVGFLGSLGVKNLSATQETQETRVQFLGWEDPLEEGMEPTPVLLPGESYGQRSPVGYSPYGHIIRHDWRDLTHTHIPESIRHALEFNSLTRSIFQNFYNVFLTMLLVSQPLFFLQRLLTEKKKKKKGGLEFLFPNDTFPHWSSSFMAMNYSL